MYILSSDPDSMLPCAAPFSEQCIPTNGMAFLFQSSIIMCFFSTISLFTFGLMELLQNYLVIIAGKSFVHLFSLATNTVVCTHFDIYHSKKVNESSLLR